MKNKIWLLQIPFVVLFTFLFYVSEAGIAGNLRSEFLRDHIWQGLRRVAGLFTDAKFNLRGPQAPKNKIVVVEIDSESLEALGRWPWHRDIAALLIDRVFNAGAKVVGIDIVFSEEDRRVSDELRQYLKQRKVASNIDEFETDRALEGMIAQHRDKLVTGWTTEHACQPAFDGGDSCFYSLPDFKAEVPKNFEKFSYTAFSAPTGFHQKSTPLVSVPDFIVNIPSYNAVGAHSGYFNTWLDPDGVVRRTILGVMADAKPYPSLALEMARIGLKEDLKLTLDTNEMISRVEFMKSGREISVSPMGQMEINFRGGGFTFPYISAMQVMFSDQFKEIPVTINRKIASFPTAKALEMLKDAYVLIGVTAVGVYDMRAFPFDTHVPGVEGHANILDNILSGDMMIHRHGKADVWLLFFLMTVGALVFAYTTQRLESVPGLLLFVASMGTLALVDLQGLFKNSINWNSSLLYIEMTAIFAFTLAVKYVMEEKNKKFIRGAFSKYVAPTIVDSILKDPSKLSVGGVRKELTILFSDIRGFTTFSERMDAKKLSTFLNDYLGIMTEIVFECEGTLDKYIGDAVMAFWGAPLDQPKHAANACKAAARMLQALADNRERFKTQYDVEVNIGIGLNSGHVSVGNMGSERIFEYTVIGDHVNLASRLEGLTKAYRAGVVTTRFTFDCIKASGEAFPAHRVLDFVKVKGKKNAVELIQVLDRQMSDAALQKFADGREFYRNQKWDQAIAAFQAVGPDDGPSQMFIERCQEFKQAPPSADWDGSWEMHSK